MVWATQAPPTSPSRTSSLPPSLGIPSGTSLLLLPTPSPAIVSLRIRFATSNWLCQWILFWWSECNFSYDLKKNDVGFGLIFWVVVFWFQFWLFRWHFTYYFFRYYMIYGLVWYFWVELIKDDYFREKKKLFWLEHFRKMIDCSPSKIKFLLFKGYSCFSVCQ